MASLVVLGMSPTLVGPILLVQSGTKVVGVTSVELLRPQQGLPLAVLTAFDGSTQLAVTRWSAGRYTGVGIVELEPASTPLTGDVVPLDVHAVHASPDTRGAPAALVTVVQADRGFARVVVPVQVDADDGGGMSDRITRLASAMEGSGPAVATDGAPLFAWYPAVPALGRPSELLAVAVSTPYRAAVSKPRPTAVLGELLGLEDLGRALLEPQEPDPERERARAAGEIVE